ncbi:MAG TPA: cupredoxin domain-containing protein [Syntrophales bacterium]|nr:cupredoxin domain-containing protein [Syntrophales bacterium]
MNSIRRRWVIAMLLVLFSLGASAAERKEYHATVDPDGVQRIEVLGGSYFFDPNYIVVKVNVPVELKIRKESGMTPHNVVLHAPDAGMDIRLDLTTDPQVIRFTPTRAGEYEFYCDKTFLFFESHREKGMVGMLVVSP